MLTECKVKKKSRNLQGFRGKFFNKSEKSLLHLIYNIVAEAMLPPLEAMLPRLGAMLPRLEAKHLHNHIVDISKMVT